MSIITAADLPPPLPPLPPKRGWPILAWLVIAGLVAVAIGLDQLAAKIVTRSDRSYLSDVQLQGRYIIGVTVGFGQPPGMMYQQIKEELNRGPYEQRLRFIVLAGELQGPAEALDQLAAMRENHWEQHPPTDEERELTALVEKVYRAYDAGNRDATTLSDEERAELRKKLDWFGDLALAPANGSDTAARAAVLAAARKTAIAYIVVALVVLFMAVVGFLLLLVGFVLLASQLVVPHFRTGSRDGGVYAETFALWMLLYMGQSLVAMYVMHKAEKFVPGVAQSRLLVVGLFGLSSLVVLLWPVLRGVTWQRVRQDIGWWAPRPGIAEPFWGIGCYLASIPLVMFGVMVSAGMLLLYKRIAGDDPFAVPMRPSHPVTEMLFHGSVWERVQILLLAAVFAPIIEETMFRGVLYRHLREVGSRWPRGVSVLFSGFVCSFVFAVIHPQGFLGVPMLMALAVGFTVARELRGSLVGAIAAHGLNNGLVTLVALSLT